MAAKRKSSKAKPAAAAAKTAPRTELTPELVDELVATHRASLDFPMATAILCNVHPKLLSRLLARGLEEDAEPLYADLAVRFLQAEMQIRAELLRELRDTKENARVSALTWILGKRFGAYRQATSGVQPVDLLELLEDAQARGGMDPTQRNEVLRRMLNDPTPPVSSLLAECGYTKTTGTEKTPNGVQEIAH